ncbi:MAG TPA: hypothetical protein DCE44_20700, partial [Verrucomicrobiales bacterium]|nr:hypothetical protein [Verrucomicrobiales bacterium]
MSRRLFAAGLSLLICQLSNSSRAADVRLTGILPQSDGSVFVSHTSNTNSYYLLLRGDRLESIISARDAALGAADSGLLHDSASLATTRFFRVREVPADAPLDSDGDGIDDVYELRTTGLNPLNSADANTLAPGAGGKTYLEVYESQQVPLTTLASTSPFNGEDGVSVTRETVFRFTRPVSSGATFSTANVYATFGGRKLLSRVELASDRRSVTLFGLENLPDGARVRVTIDPGDTRDDLGRRLDLAGNGQPGSIGQIDFDTASVTPVGETAVIGHVFASA